MEQTTDEFDKITHIPEKDIEFIRNDIKMGYRAGELPKGKNDYYRGSWRNHSEKIAEKVNFETIYKEIEDSAIKKYPPPNRSDFRTDTEYASVMVYYEVNRLIWLDGFKAGAKWRDEQRANEAVEFAEWCENENYSMPINRSIGNDSLLSVKELYDLWKSKR